MMRFSNPEHQQQDLHGGSSSSLQPSPSFHLLGANHDWNHSLILNDCGFIPNGRDFHEVSSSDINAGPANLSTHMIQDLGFHWSAAAEGYMNHQGHESTLERIKEGLSSDFNLASTSCIKSEQQELLLRTLVPSGCKTTGPEPQGRDLMLDAPLAVAPRGRGGYSMVLPTTDILIANSSSSSSSPMYPLSLGMDLQALDLLASARYGRSLPGPFHSMSLPFGLGHLQDASHEQASNSHPKIASLVSGVAEMKRANTSANLENKACQSVQKKRRFETRSSCSPFKIRKEKLGDRIAALQQLVAPFGKTDTASVLMEASGYIKFLQDQVETLSVPYMRSSNMKKLRTTQGASSCEDGDEHRPDLRSRGLCLVPFSCTSYVTNENGGVWSPANFTEK